MAIAMSHYTCSWPNQDMASATPRHTRSSAPLVPWGSGNLVNTSEPCRTSAVAGSPQSAGHAGALRTVQGGLPQDGLDS